MSTKKYFKEIFEKNEKQDPLIDGLRALSVLSIIAFHVLVGIVQVYDYARAKQFILDMPSWLQILWHGEKGVDVFFLLSALVIGPGFFRNTESYNLIAAKEFLIKKFFRIYPLFLVALLLYTIGQWSYFGKYFFSNLFFLNNIIDGERTIIPVGWFLTVEVQYFILLPFLFFILKQTKRTEFVLATLFIWSIGACGMVLLNNSDLYLRPLTDLFLAADRGEFSGRMGRLFYESNLTRFGPFVAGLLLAYLRVTYSRKLEVLLKNKIVGYLTFFTAALLIGLPVLLPVYSPKSWYYNTFSLTQNFWVLATSRQMFTAGVALLILGGWYSFAAPFKVVKKLLGLGFWRPISKLAFPIYLFHFPFIAVAAIIVFGTTDVKTITNIGFSSGTMVFLFAFVLTLVFSIPLHIYVERPFIERSKKA